VLGDLYQDLNENVRKRFALLQTPGFVEAFILDRTLTPAIQKFGLDATDIIDPTCGSGHFLLGAFERLYDQQLLEQPGLSPREAARLALDKVYGADINPYAVAIARVRLTLSYLEKAGIRRVKDAPALPLHLVVADSLLHNPQHAQRAFEQLDGQAETLGWRAEAFQLEDEAGARDVLHRRYAAVVGNPPYITEKDSAKRDACRAMYKSAAMQYSLAAPFCERFFQLARVGGVVGQITSNSFTKRDFGKALVTEVLPQLNLELVVNTAGAFIRGHDTPTVLLFGTHEPPVRSYVRCVLAKRGEPGEPPAGSNGLVWASIASHWHTDGYDDDFISVEQVELPWLRRHPWILAGGGVIQLIKALEATAGSTLRDFVALIGFGCMTRADDVYFSPSDALQRAGLGPQYIIEIVEGEVVRDWSIDSPKTATFPYERDECLSVTQDEFVKRRLWPYRTPLWTRREPNGDHREIGLTWWEWSRFQRERFQSRLSIAFAFVATHNHFVLDRGGRVFNRTAPIIKLPATATEDDHLALLAFLNSSTACFWMKQVFYPKATATGDISTEKGKPEANRYEFTGTGMMALPLPRWTPSQGICLASLAREALALAAQRDKLSARELVRSVALSREGAMTELAIERDRAEIEKRLATVQEDIDWLVYELFGLADGYEPTAGAHDESTRPFVSREESGASLPAVWTGRLSQLVASTNLQCLETPVFKRLWSGRRGVFGHSVRTVAEAVPAETHAWIQKEVEQSFGSGAETQSLREISSRLAGADPIRRVAMLGGFEDADTAVRYALSNGDAVPFLAAHRLSASGLKKWARWQRLWQLQRDEDHGGPAPTESAPKYIDIDFKESRYWRLRGVFDVPKERFISYPGCESDEDREPVYGWAGWNHLQRARALASLYWKRKTEEEWSADRLAPMLAGLLELLPWVKQWHNAPDAESGEKMGDYFSTFLDGECRTLGLTHADLEAWRPTKRNAKTAPAKPGPDADVDPATVKAKGSRKKKAAAPDALTDDSLDRG
jgi:hypothetical protein